MTLIPPNRDPPLEEILDKHGNRLKTRERIVRALHELGGEATARQIASHLSGRNGPSVHQVAANLATRRDVRLERGPGDVASTYHLEREDT